MTLKCLESVLLSSHFELIMAIDLSAYKLFAKIGYCALVM